MCTGRLIIRRQFEKGIMTLIQFMTCLTKYVPSPLYPPSPSPSLLQLILPAVPVFISATGLYDVEYHVSVACRDACVYTLKTGGHTPKYKIPLGSQPCGLQRMDKNIFIGCMDNTLACYSTKVREKYC